MKIKKFSAIENQVDTIINTSFSTKEIELLTTEQLDYLKGTIFTHLAKIGKIDNSTARLFFRDILEGKKVV